MPTAVPPSWMWPSQAHFIPEGACHQSCLLQRKPHLRDSSPAAELLSVSRVNCIASSSTSTVAETVMQPFTRKPAFGSRICVHAGNVSLSGDRALLVKTLIGDSLASRSE